eukprot:COSAG01_NODE_62789_length_283_cov_0.364130_2_plen_51_part_01
MHACDITRLTHHNVRRTFVPRHVLLLLLRQQLLLIRPSALLNCVSRQTLHR